MPDESTASFAGSQAYDILDDDQQMLIDIEQNIANLERSLSTGRQESWQSPEKPAKKSLLQRAISLNTPNTSPSAPTGDKLERKRSSAFRNVKNLMKIGKQRPPKDSGSEDENAALIHTSDSGRNSRHHSDSESAPISRAESQTSLTSNADSQESVSLYERGKKSSRYEVIAFF